MFKRFFNWIINTGTRIVNSRELEFFLFVHNSITTAIDWVKMTGDFITMIQNVGLTVKIIGKYIFNRICELGSKLFKRTTKFAH